MKYFVYEAETSCAFYRLISSKRLFLGQKV